MNKLPVFNYHGIERHQGEYGWSKAEASYVVSAAKFEEQLSLILERGFSSLDIHELKGWSSHSYGERKIMLTFDDGHISHFEHVMPLLLKYHMKGIFFIPVGLIGGKDQMGWRELRELIRGRFQIGSHGLRHIPLWNLSEEQLREELERSKKIIEDRFSIPVESFSVPRGFYTPAVRNMAAQVGYRYVFTSKFDFNSKIEDYLSLKRLVITKKVTHSWFSRVLDGELGIKRYVEGMKESARKLLGPSRYEVLVDLKYAVPPKLFLATGKEGKPS